MPKRTTRTLPAAVPPVGGRRGGPPRGTVPAVAVVVTPSARRGRPVVPPAPLARTKARVAAPIPPPPGRGRPVAPVPPPPKKRATRGQTAAALKRGQVAF
jgi:hypothetical protein